MLQKFEDSLTEQNYERRKSFFDKVKGVFGSARAR
jgi:hypothetical protein